MKKISSLIFISLIILFSISACNLKPFQLETDQDCSSPCWHHIVPGQTTKQEMLSILEQIPEVQAGSIWSKGESWNSFNDVARFSLSNKVDVEVYFYNNKVALMYFYGKTRVTIGDMINKVGEPENLLTIYLAYGPFRLDGSPHKIVYLLNPEKGIAYRYDSLDIPKSWRSEIRPDIKISGIDYFDPGVYHSLLEVGMFPMGDISKETLDRMKPWTGFGKLPDIDN